MPTRRRTKLPALCPRCHTRERPPFQAMCQSCSTKHRVYASGDELLVARWVEYHLARELPNHLIVSTAVLRLERRKVLTVDERIELGVVLWGYGDALDRAGLVVPACDSLYRKLMGHHRQPTCRRGIYRLAVR